MEAREVRMRCLEAALRFCEKKDGIYARTDGVLTVAREFETHVMGADAQKPGQPVLTGLGARTKDVPTTRA